MTENVVNTDGDTITDIQDYLSSFNKEIGDTGDQNATATTIATTNSNMIGDTIYIQDPKMAGNIVIESGENSGQEGNYPTFMVMNDNQQYMLIVQDGDQAVTNDQSGTLVVTTESVAPNEQNNHVNIMETPEPPKKKSFRNKRIKQEVVEEDNRNDISVYDFNELNMPNRNSSTIDTSIESSIREQPSLDEEEEDDPDYKTPVMTRTRGRAAKSGESSGKKNKSNSGTLMLNNTGGSSGNVHVCTYCSYSSTKRYLLSRHLKSHSEDRPHKCGICERGFKTLASLQNHVNTHTGVRPHQCKFCDAAFTTSGELVRHIRYRHTHEKPHRCSECDYASVELSKLKRHMRCHTGERPYQCPHCTYASPDTYKLKRHLRIHTGEKPYVCDVCHQRFTQSNSLKAHRLIHTGNKPIFKCEFCPTTCGRKTDLRIHVQKLHTSDKMLTCKRCDQSFPDRYQFKLHLKSHEGEKCFKCDLCNYASVSARHLESHMLIHTDQKPFICEVCALSFRQKQLLKRHKNLYHNPSYVPPTPKEKTHECSQCNKAFRHKGNLIRHMMIHDPDSKHHFSKDPNSLDHSQLIDDEIYEDEDDFEPEEVSIVTDGGTILDSGTATVSDGTIAITIDPQTQQLINSGNDQVMFVVQYNNNEGSEEATVTNGQPTVVAVTGASTVSTPRIISRGGRVTRSSAKASDVQTLFETVTDEKPTIVTSSGENIISIQQAPQIAFDNAETVNLEEQLQKQKDLEACFGFKDEDDEDDIILAMPAVDGQ